MIHRTAIIEEAAQLAKNVQVGAYAYIGKDVILGEGTVVHHHATVDGVTRIGKNNEIFPYSFIGGKTQDLKYVECRPELYIGDNNIFREYTTVHCGTNEQVPTRIGSRNHVLAYSHIAHECQIGNDIIISSYVAVGGHVEIGDFANISGTSGVHQHCKIGTHAFLGAGAILTQDLLPFMIASGTPASVQTVNQVGLERHGFTEDQRATIRKIFKLFYKSGLNRTQAIEALKGIEDAHLVGIILEFIKGATRGLA